MDKKLTEKPKLVERRYLLPFILVTSLFALWGFANDITNPMVAAFQTLMELPASEAALVQFAFYGGYATMAVPAALFIRRHSYKSGILLGLGLYAVGAFLFIPAAHYQAFSFFCISLYILTFGLAFLEESIGYPLDDVRPFEFLHDKRFTIHIKTAYLVSLVV
mgnify:FL=1